MSALPACLVTTGTVHWTLSLPLGQAHTGGLGHYGFNVHFENEYIEESEISNELYCTVLYKYLWCSIPSRVIHREEFT